MTRQTIKTNYLCTIDWLNGHIIDWVSAGKEYSLDGNQKQRYRDSYGAFAFDASITSKDGQYAFIYTRLGTKGLLLKHGELIREINRSYYYAGDYEYPAAFIYFNNKTYLAHCPFKYRQLDFEDVETGEVVTNISGRNPVDTFHSRLSISPDNKYLMTRGWNWHPLDIVKLYDISACFYNPLLLDDSSVSPSFGTEISSASFLDNNRILIASSDEPPLDDEIQPLLPPKHIAIWNFVTNEISNPLQVEGGVFGNLYAINEKYAWDMYEFPKIINIETGEIKSKCQEIDSGLQSSSFISPQTPQICFDRNTSNIAIKIDSKTIEVLSPI